MRHALCLALLLAAVSSQAFAAKLTLSGKHGPTVVTTPFTGVTNKGKITGGVGTGLTVTGTATKSVTNKGTITGATGLSVKGGSSTVVNTGVISATSTSHAVGISVKP